MKVHFIKKGSKLRKVYIPSNFEMATLKRIKNTLDWIYLTMGIPDSAHGFIHCRNCVTNALVHIGYKYSISIDLKDFFESVTAKHLKGVPVEILDLILVEGSTRQGLPTSPTASNIAMREFDLWAESRYTYSRYVDDITISGNDLELLKKQIKEIEERLNELGFKLNKKKTSIQGMGGRRIITGISVGDDVKASRKSRRKLRAATHQKNAPQARGLQEWCKCKVPLDVYCEPVGNIENPGIKAMQTMQRTIGERKFPRIIYSGSRSGYPRTFKGSIASLKKRIVQHVIKEMKKWQST